MEELLNHKASISDVVILKKDEQDWQEVNATTITIMQLATCCNNLTTFELLLSKGIKAE